MSLLRLISIRSSSKLLSYNLGVISVSPAPLFSASSQRQLVAIRGTSSHVRRQSNQDAEGDLVYSGTISSMVRNVKLLSLSTSAVGLGFQPYIYMRADELGTAGLLMGGVFGFFIFLTPLLLHYVTKKYVTELYMKPGHEFTAYTWSFLLRKRKLTFTPDDVIQPGVPGPFTTITIKGRPLFMDPSYFTNPAAYRTMMGYNKPIDWSFPEEIHRKSGEDEINRRQEP